MLALLRLLLLAAPAGRLQRHEPASAGALYLLVAAELPEGPAAATLLREQCICICISICICIGICIGSTFRNSRENAAVGAISGRVEGGAVLSVEVQAFLCFLCQRCMVEQTSVAVAVAVAS
jgi:uncharacterized membrane protein